LNVYTMGNSMDYPLQTWRLLLSPPATGAWNMAVDEAILQAIGQNRSLPTLRLYSWQPPCLSIGYAQPCADINQPKLRHLGWDWVRRPTGGRAILHTDELTYSVIAPISEPRLSGSILESYQRLSKALLEALISLSIPAAANPLTSPLPSQDAQAICFEVPSNYEIVVNCKKLIGSAQARRKEGVLQHGSLPLYGDLTRITQVLVYEDESAREEANQRLLAHATTVETVLSHPLSWDTAAQAFIAGFRSELNLALIQDDLSDQEIYTAKELVKDKYSHPGWLKRI
jgi:lipoate-protein ligase A